MILYRGLSFDELSFLEAENPAKAGTVASDEWKISKI